MKHHILVKFNENVTDRAVLQAAIAQLFANAAHLPGIHGVRLIPNCVDRPNRYDLLILLDMDESALQTWDESAIHREWKARFGTMLSAKAIFDSRE